MKAYPYPLPESPLLTSPLGEEIGMLSTQSLSKGFMQFWEFRSSGVQTYA
jgi:hypothetical protein